MPFYDRQYTVFVVLAGPTAQALWSSFIWSRLATALKLFTESPRGKSTIRTLQYSQDGKPVPFGRLGWDERSHAKWTHHDAGSDPRRFVHVEAWAPSSNQCSKENLAPDFYLAIANEQLLGPAKKQFLFNQRILVALATDRIPSVHAHLKSVVQKLAKDVSAPLLVQTERPWGLPTGSGGFTDAIQDMLIGHLFKPGDPHSRPLDLATFSELWTVAGEA